jgi:hypothetical protein
VPRPRRAAPGAGDLLPELLDALPQRLPLDALAGDEGLDPPKRLDDREILRLEPLEPPAELVEVAEDLAKLLFLTCGKAVDAAVGRVEPPVDLSEPPVDLGEPLAEELDQALVLTVRHGTSLGCWRASPYHARACKAETSRVDRETSMMPRSGRRDAITSEDTCHATETALNRSRVRAQLTI